MTGLGLYVHVPFCRTRCRYCDFYRVGANGPRMTAFLDALIREIEARTAWHGRPVDSVFLGGGTPSLLEAAQLRALLDLLARRFSLTADCEITVECNPSDLSPARLRAYRHAGVNRLSLGVQSFNDRELKLIGRRHDAARARGVIREARRAGFENISLDLILALPGQTRASFRDSVEQAIALQPDHLSVYILEIHPELEIDLLRRRRPGLFPDDDEQSRRYRWMVERLEATGLMRYEISNFARQARRSRHNLKYWNCEPVLGFGPSAHSLIDGRRWRNPPDLRSYLVTPTACEDQSVDLIQESLFLGLRLREGVHRERLESGLKLDPADLERRVAALTPFVEMIDDRVRLTVDGVLVSTPVLAELLFGDDVPRSAGGPVARAGG